MSLESQSSSTVRAPKHVVFLSRCLTTLDFSSCETSSQLFELGLARTLARHTQVSILTLREAERLTGHGVELISLARFRYPLIHINASLREIGFHLGNNSRLIMYGYNPLALGMLRLVAWQHRSKLISYVFDTHATATESKRFFRKFLINLYYELGTSLLRSVDAVFLLNPNAYRRLRLKRTPVLVSRVGVNASLPPTSLKAPAQPEYRVAYAGSLEPCNGIIQLLKSMTFIDDPAISLTIVGDGSLTPQVQHLAADDSRVTLMGRVNKAAVDNVIRSSDLVVNLRDINDPVVHFSFPSKLIDYMASGVPVLSTIPMGGTESNSLLRLASGLAPEDIARDINDAKKEEKHRAMARALAAHRYVGRHHLWPDIGDEVIDFLAKL